MQKTRDPEKTRHEILRAGYKETFMHGFQASSVDSIVERAGITKGAFFHHFPTKNELGYAIADEILREMMLDRWIRPLAAYQNPVKGMITRYRRNMEETSEENLGYGCPLNNLTQEMSAVDPVFRESLQAVLDGWIEETEVYLKKAQDRGYVKREVDVKMAAMFMVMAEEGSAAIIKNLRDRKAYWALYEGFKQFMESISTTQGTEDRG